MHCSKRKLQILKTFLSVTTVTFYYRGRPSRGVLAGDDKHLSRRGTKILGGNLEFSIYDALGE